MSKKKMKIAKKSPAKKKPKAKLQRIVVVSEPLEVPDDEGD